MVALAVAVLYQINIFAQLTVDGAMALAPDLPTVAQMVAYEDGDEDQDMYVKFHKTLEKARQKCQEMMARNSAMAGVQKAYGKAVIDALSKVPSIVAESYMDQAMFI